MVHDNVSTNPQARAAQKKEYNRNLGNAFLTYGGGEVLGKIFSIFGDFAKPTIARVVENTGAKKAFDVVAAFNDAVSSFNGKELTKAGRAVAKHPSYFGYDSYEALSKVYRTTSSLNDLGSSTIKDILRNGVKTTGAGGRYPSGWVTYTLRDGRAASWLSNGSFVGFRGIK